MFYMFGCDVGVDVGVVCFDEWVYEFVFVLYVVVGGV